MNMANDKTPVLPKGLEPFLDLPYGGLFGDSVHARVVEEMVADPNRDYRPKDLARLTDSSAPAIRKALATLVSLGLITKDSSDRQHPVYRVDVASKKFVALTLLAFAAVDDRDGTHCMEDAAADHFGTDARKGKRSSKAAAPDLRTRLYMSHVAARRLAETLASMLDHVGRKGRPAGAAGKRGGG
jgi:hypothetical protein